MILKLFFVVCKLKYISTTLYFDSNFIRNKDSLKQNQAYDMKTMQIQTTLQGQVDWSQFMLFVNQSSWKFYDQTAQNLIKTCHSI